MKDPVMIRTLFFILLVTWAATALLAMLMAARLFLDGLPFPAILSLGVVVLGLICAWACWVGTQVAKPR